MQTPEKRDAMAVVFENTDLSALALAESILSEAGIPFFRKEEASSSAPWTGARPFGLEVHQLLVARAEAEDARALLADLSRPLSAAEGDSDPGRQSRMRTATRWVLAVILGGMVVLFLMEGLWRLILAARTSP